MAQSLRDKIRTAVFSAAPDTRVIQFFGQDVEVRQPSLEDLINSEAVEDRRKAAVAMLIKYTYVPGTSERVFEEADGDSLLALPFNADMRRLQQAVNELMGIADIEEQERKNS